MMGGTGGLQQNWGKGHGVYRALQEPQEPLHISLMHVFVWPQARGRVWSRVSAAAFCRHWYEDKRWALGA